LLAAPSVTARDGDAEGLPNVIVEAAASALPVVGTDHSGIPEAIVEGETGFIVPERDSERLAARILAILSDPARRGRMGAAARAMAEQRFDFACQMRRLEEIYDEVRAG
jgi:glycosyltransferase involved in cell wall biosynthesis